MFVIVAVVIVDVEAVDVVIVAVDVVVVAVEVVVEAIDAFVVAVGVVIVVIVEAVEVVVAVNVCVNGGERLGWHFLFVGDGDRSIGILCICVYTRSCSEFVV